MTPIETSACDFHGVDEVVPMEPSRGFGPETGPDPNAGRPEAVRQELPTKAHSSNWRPQPRSFLVNVIIILLIAAAIAAVLYAWQLPPFGGRYERTDDAYVRGQTTVISPQVSGYVREVPVKDFDHVEAGQVLVRIEDSIYGARVEQAHANVLSQMANLDNSEQAQRSKEAGELSQDAAIASAEAQLNKVRADLRRTEALAVHGWVTQAERDRQIAAMRAAEAQLSQARAAREIGTQEVRTVVVGRAGLHANVEAAKAQVRLAQVDFDHTVIKAPQDGQLSEIGVRPGQYVSAGTQLMYLVPKALWVTANFKEAQTHRIKVGQSASFTVDALGGARLTGLVESLAPAAGSEFAVLKPDNVTGNFVKVAQRIAVRIRVDPDQPLARQIRPGMSVVVRIDTAQR
jgi:multidrug resistance efflux pump